MADNGKVLIVAGEASGDGYAARLASSLRRIRPSVEIYGVGGSALREAGVRLIVDIKELSTFGIFEVFRRLPALIGLFFKILGSIKEERPGLVILIDYPDFNLRLAKFIRKRYGHDIKILYYITPQVWIWRKWRARSLATLADRLAVVFPFEEPIFKELGVETDFVGHPLLESIPSDLDRKELARDFNLDPSKPTIALLPGSRTGEIKNYLPVMIEAARELNKEGKYQFLLARAPGISEEEIGRYLGENNVDIRQIAGQTHRILKAADLGVVALGTATLEAALMGTPAILVGWVQPMTHWFGIKFLNMDLPYFSLVNFILKRPAFPELIQDDMKAENIAKSVRELIANPKAMEVLRNAAKEVQQALRSGEDTVNEAASESDRKLDPSERAVGASNRAAMIAHKMLSHENML